MIKKIFFTAITVSITVFALTNSSRAHVPFVKSDEPTRIENPQNSKVYYSKLDGNQDLYTITSEEPFTLYLNLLVPDVPDVKKDFEVTISRDGQTLTSFSGKESDWDKYYEPVGANSYLKGPELTLNAEPGMYEIKVSNAQMSGKYALAVGEIESFSLVDTLRSLVVVPTVRRDFFEESAISHFKSPLSWLLIIVSFGSSVIFGLGYRYILKRLSKNKNRKRSQNIGRSDKLSRYFIGIVLFIFAVTTTWSPIILFFSGFTLFEAVFSWCGFYAALGKNTCPV